MEKVTSEALASIAGRVLSRGNPFDDAASQCNLAEAIGVNPGAPEIDSLRDFFQPYMDDLAALAGSVLSQAGRVRHQERGTEYRVLGVGKAQGVLNDEDPIVVYQGDDGVFWARGEAEFNDGRFVALEAPVAELTPEMEVLGLLKGQYPAGVTWGHLANAADLNAEIEHVRAQLRSGPGLIREDFEDGTVFATDATVADESIVAITWPVEGSKR